MKYIKIGGAYQVFEEFEVMTEVEGYRVSHTLFELYESGKLIVKKFFTWDGASGWFDVRSIMKASCVHDILTIIINSGEIPSTEQYAADETFRRIESRQNMPQWEQFATYLAVRWYQMRKKYKYPIPPPRVYDTEISV